MNLALAAGLLFVLGAALPGHMSFDSVWQLYEGHFNVRETWGPPVYAWLLGVFDRVIPGASLYVATSVALFFGSLWTFAAVRGRASWWGVAFACALPLTPQVLIYQGDVWKDVAFANCAFGGTACVAVAFTRWPARAARWTLLAGAAALFALGAVVRQNGVLMPLTACLAVGLVAARGDWRRFALWAGGWLLAVVVIMQLLSTFAVPHNMARQNTLKTGVRIVQAYDLVGALARDPSYRLTVIERARPAQAAAIHDLGPPLWSPDRVDFLGEEQRLEKAWLHVPSDLMTRQWLDLIVAHPMLYLRVRLDDYRWLMTDPNPARCLPVFTGVDAPAEKMSALGLPHRYSGADRQLTNYDTFFWNSPLQRHWTWALVSIVVCALLAWRRQPADLAMLALNLGALAVTASFFVISLACDYRYLLMQDLAAMAGVFYLLVDPTGFRRRASGTAAG